VSDFGRLLASLASLASFDIFLHVPRGYLSHHSRRFFIGSVRQLWRKDRSHSAIDPGSVSVSLGQSRSVSVSHAACGSLRSKVGVAQICWKESVAVWQLDGKGRSHEKMINTSGPKIPKMTKTERSQNWVKKYKNPTKIISPKSVAKSTDDLPLFFEQSREVTDTPKLVKHT
jgi:hypothetical protein